MWKLKVYKDREFGCWHLRGFAKCFGTWHEAFAEGRRAAAARFAGREVPC